MFVYHFVFFYSLYITIFWQELKEQMELWMLNLKKEIVDCQTAIATKKELSFNQRRVLGTLSTTSNSDALEKERLDKVLVIIDLLKKITLHYTNRKIEREKKRNINKMQEAENCKVIDMLREIMLGPNRNDSKLADAALDGNLVLGKKEKMFLFQRCSFNSPFLLSQYLYKNRRII